MSWKNVKLSELLNYLQPTQYIVNGTDYNDMYTIPVLTAGKTFILGYTNEDFGVFEDVPVIIFDDFTAAIKYVDFPFKVKSSAMKILYNDSSKTSVKFLFYLLQTIKYNASEHKRHWISSFSQIEVKIPPLEQQKNIAAILNAADAYRHKTKALIAKYDELTQSLFLDMFGDPVKNEKGWEKIRASKYYEVRGRVGWKGYKKTDLRDKGAIVLGATHVNSSGELDLTKVVYLSNEKFEESPEIVVKLNDLIFVQRGNTIGKIGLVRKDLGKATINPVVLIFRPIGANPLFLLYLLMNKELNREFVNSNSGSAQPMITQKFMKDFLLIKIPINHQNQFAELVQAIEQQKAQAQASLEKAEELFNSLLQRAFKGELV